MKLQHSSFSFLLQLLCQVNFLLSYFHVRKRLNLKIAQYLEDGQVLFTI